MGSLAWTEDALTQLQEITEYVSRQSPSRAATLYARLERAAERLISLPLMGRVIPEFGVEHLRELIEAPYRILYLVKGEDCFIIGVVHSRRDLTNLVYPQHFDDLLRGDDANDDPT